MSEAFCTGCGSALAPGAAFCGSCGAATDARLRAASQPDMPAVGAAPASQVAEPQAPPPVYDPPPVQPAAAPYNPPPPAPAYPNPAYSAPPVAPSYATPPPFQAGTFAQPSLATDPANEPLARAYIGPNADYYLGKWRTIGAAGKPNSWNWAAFLLNAWWLVYRRMWTPAMGALAAIFVLNLAGVFMPGARALTSGLTLGVCALIGWRGNDVSRPHGSRDRAIRRHRARPKQQDGLAADAGRRGHARRGRRWRRVRPRLVRRSFPDNQPGRLRQPTQFLRFVFLQLRCLPVLERIGAHHRRISARRTMGGELHRSGRLYQAQPRQDVHGLGRCGDLVAVGRRPHTAIQ